jgi:hypothetical protein
MKTQKTIPGWGNMFGHSLLPFLLIAAILISLAGLYLYPSPWEFPMDDTYIHFVYARNLAGQGRLFFNVPGETGVGTTSLTWVLLLAGAWRLGVPSHLAAKIFGLLSLVSAGWGLYLLFCPLLRRLPALALSLLVTASGHLLWFALSGMETALFFALGILALLLYRERRFVALGITLGLLALTRPDGLALCAAIGFVEGSRRGKDILKTHRARGSRPTAGWFGNAAWRLPRPAGYLLSLLLCFLVCAPWFGYLLWRTGHILPTSAVGKQVSSLIGLRLVVSQNPALSFLAQFPALAYVSAWTGYLLEFTLGGMSLPGPGLPVASSPGSPPYHISYLAILFWIVVLLPLLLSFIQWLRAFLRQQKYYDQQYRPFLAFSAWLVLHNLAYAFFLPIPGTASRYGVINHLALWLALLIGLLRLTPRPNWQRGMALGLLVIAAANTIYWNHVYDANLEHMLNVRIAAAQYVRNQFPDVNVAAFDVGVLRFYSQRPITDLGGLIDPLLGEVYRSDGHIDRYLAERYVRYVILPGQAGATEQGWFDFAREMGLTTSPFFTLHEERVFAIDYQRWLLGYLPTNNYQATVTIYRLEK